MIQFFSLSSGFGRMKKTTPVTIIVFSWIILVSPPLLTNAFAATSASFVRLDSAVAGNWVGNYGADGYDVAQDSYALIPSYAKVTFNNKINWLWADNLGGWIGVQQPENPSVRIAGQWCNPVNFTIDVNLTDGNTHQIALYALDWDASNRAQTVNVLNASTGAVLDSRSLPAGSFVNGTYLVWNVTGHVTFQVVNTGGRSNATISGVFFGGAAATSSPTPAVAANTFLSSLGINTHIEQGWGGEAPDEPLFKYTGIRNARDGWDPSVTSMYLTLHNNTGVQMNLIGTDKPSVASFISGAQTLASAGALVSIEGPNEPNNWPITYNGQVGGGGGTWVPVAQFQNALYTQAKANPVLANYPVFSVSEGGAEVNNVGLQFLTIPVGAGTVMPSGTQYADYGNLHNYLDGSVLQDNQAWDAADRILRSHNATMFGEYGVTWAHNYTGYSTPQLQTLPVVTTETGWGTVGPGALTEAQQGKVLLNVYLAQFKRGFRYTYIYEFVDGQGGDSTGEGIFHANYTPKASATFIHNFTTILADTNSFSPSSLNYAIPLEPARVHDLLLQKSNGTYYLIVWDERANGVVDNVTVKLAVAHSSVKVYDPTTGTGVTKTLSNVSSIPLTLSDHPLILAISPQ